ncbi:hypothetical protein [Intrasporangium calvum]|uniref:Glycosyltransferase RgtA/B/C/D-like domain-containing protein n=1 Tax=Intrasporangium calvum (strain ATCC 23552 / DSM 43043 / JCM 3097 / NBRC 12989 / NCIMB 10167 / NRRL B-3866 / 7 KIP) TaxID=710696 RepID=E6SDI8_INTC7|nr:hypothetical protein [Intrasporangium calvum]ADU48640.1 hypothetical protein Intca_2130 [Intrasporangium calvum DSM 43043]
METPVGRALLRLTGVSLVLVVVVALVAPRQPNISYDRAVVVPALVVFLVAAWFGRVPVRLKNRWLPVVVAVVGGGVAAGLGLALRYDFGWDARVILEMARSMHAGRALSDVEYGYLSLYPNTIPLLVIDRFGVEVAAALGLAPDAALIVLTAVCVGVTVYAAHLLLVPVAGRGAALVTQLVVVALVGASPWVSVPYTDYYAMPFVVGGVALAAAAGRRRVRTAQVTLGLLAVAASAVAYVIKTTPAVVIVALVAVVIVRLADDWSPARARKLVPTAVAAALAFLAISSALTAGAALASGLETDRVDRDVSPPVVWWLANGMNEQLNAAGEVQYGTYRRDMVTAIEGRTQPEMREYARAFVEDRWDHRGVSGMLQFYANKTAWNWGDGMFWAWGEGPDSLPGRVVPRDPVAVAVNDVNGLHGRWYPLRANITQGLWLAVLLVAGVGLLRERSARRETLILAVTVLGIAMFTILFQGRSRYLFAFVPVVVALAAVGRSRVELGSIRQRLGPR